jgi:hypothetical protein
LGSDIPEGETLVVLIENIGRNLFADNLSEDGIGHGRRWGIGNGQQATGNRQ